MTQTELASYMIELGACNAVNLDGGGSTSMVARTASSGNLEIINTPSDGSIRKVTNAIGIFSISPPMHLDRLVIETADSNVFINTSREFTVCGFDKLLNPIKIDPEDI